ncbi:hypothetical protein V8E54_010545 [Elaphomyces granulatus]|jgi:SAP domain-containing ribonucleoprotein
MAALDYAKRTNADLIEILKSRSLPTTGKKAELVARLREDDAKRNATLPSTTKTDTADDFIDWDDDAPAEEAARPSTKADAAAVAADGEEKAPSPVAVPDENPGINPATTNDLEVESKGPDPSEDSKAKDDTPVDATATTATAAATATATATATTTSPASAEETSQPPEKPQADYSIGLPSTELEAELKKRKARAEKFGIVKDTETALADAEKAAQRAKRFGTGDEGSGIGIKGLDEALPSERPRKRGRGDEENRRGNKRRNLGGRGRNTRQTRNRDGGRSGHRKPVFNEKDALANEARKNRFAAAA